MSSRTRLVVLSVSAPVIVFAIVGGFLGKVMAREEPYQHLRMIDSTPTRDMSVWEGVRALRGAPGSTVKLTVIRGNAVEPHVIELTREILSGPDVIGRIAAPGVGYVRIVAVGPKAVDQVKSQ